MKLPMALLSLLQQTFKSLINAIVWHMYIGCTAPPWRPSSLPPSLCGNLDPAPTRCTDWKRPANCQPSQGPHTTLLVFCTTPVQGSRLAGSHSSPPICLVAAASEPAPERPVAWGQLSSPKRSNAAGGGNQYRGSTSWSLLHRLLSEMMRHNSSHNPDFTCFNANRRQHADSFPVSLQNEKLQNILLQNDMSIFRSS